MPDSPHVDAVIVGAGAVGLAIARALTLRGRAVAVLEGERRPAHHASSRNSEVIHAGFYYPGNSLKASMCVRGQQLLYEYCHQHGIAAWRCGKLVVAHDDAGIEKLHQLRDQGIRNGVAGLTIIGRDQLAAREPGVSAIAALHSAATGILDSHAYLDSLQRDVSEGGGIIACGSRFQHASFHGTYFHITFTDDDGLHRINADQLVNAGGLFASDVALNIEGVNRAVIPETRWARGNYFSLAGRSPCQTLVYPLPAEDGLGIHLTLDIGGGARFGPDVVWTDRIDYRPDRDRREAFVEAVGRYLPGVDPSRLQPAWAGIRAKAFRAGVPVNDFVIQGPAESGLPGLVQLFGIESPGLTSSLAIAERCAELLEG